MIPNLNLDDDILEDLNEKNDPSYTYKMDKENYRILDYCDGLEAVKQAVYKILNTERYDYTIYSQNYGIELEELFGEPTSYVIPELERRIIEALSMDDRIEEVYNFDFNTTSKGIVAVTFHVDTIHGSTKIDMEVEY
ncbi:DUF2634 domain-containing protein [Candidatus Galacturonibacter soehngenii]|uniref:DUF2634 domain-containing protein n=1 Tax=Candidatus Galacturonatibacter soehngenii TaxID=2307010 RepID=A0A7V7UAX1_9FIRM|nr:DUF2634 domain-containing protein [Candidatus Galacturonibacter soehngenii]KAB1436584.1 DUF2634 domain-containing protein [Candidatus Galacturonibacter soehngenii]